MALPPLPPCPEPVRAQLARLAEGLTAILADRLVGVYLHGSLALGCFQPAASDLDVLVVTERPPDPDQLSRLAALLRDTSAAPCPIEVSSLTWSYLHPWRYPTAYDFHYSETWRTRMTALLAAGSWADAPIPAGTDPDLAAHCTIVRARGSVLAGAPIAEVFPPRAARRLPGVDLGRLLVGEGPPGARHGRAFRAERLPRARLP